MNAPPPNENADGPSAQGTARHDQHPTKDTDSLSAFKVARAALALPPEVLAVLVSLLPDPAAETELRRQLGREMYAAGVAEGYRIGYERGARIRETEWPEIVKPLGEPTLAELELLRWGPGGRERFGDPRPSDRFPQTRLEAAS